MPDTIPVLYQVATATADAFGGTADADVGIPYIAKGAGPTSSPPLFTQHMRIDRLRSQLADLSLRAVRTNEGANRIGVYPGDYRKADGTAVHYAGCTGQALADGHNYVYLDRLTNTVAINITGYPASIDDYLALAEFDVTAGVITTSDRAADKRGLNLFWIQSTGASLTGIPGTTWTVDNDNAGAGADQQLRFNRGSTDAEDAAIEWDEANDRFNARKQHSTATLAPINCEQLLIGGSGVIDTSGRLVASTFTATAVTLDADNAGAGADQQLRFNRGSTDAEDAAIEWDEANDRFNFRKQHSTATLAPVNASELRVAGSVVIDSSGKLAAANLSDSVADKLAQVSVGDASGASPRTVTIQVLDLQGNNLGETVYLEVGVYQDADGAAVATDATIAVGAAGTLVRTITASKELAVKTNGSGQVQVTITDATLETIYVICRGGRRSKLLDCSDIGTVVIS